MDDRRVTAVPVPAGDDGTDATGLPFAAAVRCADDGDPAEPAGDGLPGAERRLAAWLARVDR